MHQNPPAPLPHAVFAAAARGWHVFPLVPGTKRPAIRAWEQRATTDADRIRRCWSTAPYNYGIATGPSGLLVVDLDVPKPNGTPPEDATDGAGALALLAEEHGAPYPSDTYTVRTPSGGTHLYFTAPADTRLRNTAGTLGSKIDTRAHGGYIVGPGSTVHGTTYTVTHDVPPAPLPAWLLQLLTPRPLPPQIRTLIPLTGKAKLDAYLNAAVTGELRRIRTAPVGRRNEALYIASVALGQLVAGGALPTPYVTDHLTETALGVGLPEPEARATITSGLRAGARKPRTLGGRDAA
ncbi:bifunctional DNA primase/polymerase [Streptomyces sp. NPDC058045]|uniref:bifunctional DNA primase/polymerase n=1 Tax=Streptomyces sp. NPDC058045 TaxID=3346311 RepID=UPI0036EA06EF